MAKKFFWLKIQEDFYRQKEIKFLRQLDRGATYIIIYQKMLISSLKNGNKLYYDNFKDTFEEELALLIDEDVKDVKYTIDFLKKANLIESESDDEYILTQVQELTGVESESAKRVRKHRENKNKDKNNDKDDDEDKDKDINNNKDVTEKNLCNENVTLDIDTESQKELNKELDKDTKTYSNKKSKKKSVNKCVDDSFEKTLDENFAKITKIYELNMGPIYPASFQYFAELSDKFQYELFEKAIEICIDKSNMTPSYLKGIIKKWDDQKIYTLKDFEAKQIEFLNKKQQDKKNSSKYTNSSEYQNPNNKHLEDETIDEDMLAEIENLEGKMSAN